MQLRLATICALITVGLAAGFSKAARADSLEVKIADGKVHGKLINDGKVRAFLGMPFAAPPVGELRWKAPQPVAPWSDVRDATKYGSHCMQVPFPDMSFQDAGPSEDCLYINVFAPADAKDNGKLPVMFWIYGGGYTGGSASEPRHNGDFLPTKGVVLVTFNYRLGVFGFLATQELMSEGGGSAGDYGLMDMIAALKWTHNNIAQFGGDPGNVTIFGESAGSFAVSTMMASPLAQEYFQKAIGESGSALGGGLGGRVVADEAPQGSAWARSLGAKTLADLRAIPADEILADSRKPGAPRFSPVVDGKVLTEPVAETYMAGRQAHIPLLAGWNRDEGNLNVAKGLTAEEWQTHAHAQYGQDAADFLSLYPGTDNMEAQRSAIDYAGDNFIAFGTWKWVEAQVKTGNAPVYRYHLELPAPVSKFHPESAAFHSDDIEYVFGTLATRVGAIWRPEDWKLSEQMMGYWTNFAKTGDPNGAGLPEWPRYDKTGELIHLDAPITAGPASTNGRYEFLVTNPPLSRP